MSPLQLVRQCYYVSEADPSSPALPKRLDHLAPGGRQRNFFGSYPTYSIKRENTSTANANANAHAH